MGTCFKCGGPSAYYGVCVSCKQLEAIEKQTKAINRAAKGSSASASSPGVWGIFKGLFYVLFVWGFKPIIAAFKWCWKNYPKPTKIVIGTFFLGMILLAAIDASCSGCGSKFLNLKH